MSEKRRGLGRGLGALIPTAPVRPVEPRDEDAAPDAAAGTGTAADAPTDGSLEGAGDRAASPVRAAAGDGDVTADLAAQSRSTTDGGVPDGSRAPEGAPEGAPAAPRRSLGGVDVLIPARPANGAAPVSAGWPAEADARPQDSAGQYGVPGRAEPADGRGPADGTAQPATSPDGVQPVPGAHFAEVPIASITPNPRQPRQVFDEEAMAELVHSLREVGLLQPVVVRPVDGDRYELIMGERRWRAAQEAGFDVIPAIVRSTGDDDLLRDALLENLHRSQLNPLEEAAAYGQLLEDFGCTHEELATRIGRSRPQISNTLRLLKLPALVQRRVAAGVLSAGHARALLGLPDGGAQERLAQRIVAEGLSVRAVEEIVALGGDAVPEPVQRPRGRKPVAPALVDLADRLADRFETRVKVDLGRTKGKITVEFASIQDLERIVALMTGPDGIAQPADEDSLGAGEDAPADGSLGDGVSRETAAASADD